MRTLLVWLCLLCAAVATAADFTVVHAPNPGETPLPIPQNELRAEWRFERHWPPFRLIQSPQWDLVLVAGRPLSLAFRKNRPEHALFPGSEMTCSVVEARRVSLWRDAEGRLRSLALPPRPIGYPKGTLICLGQYTGCLPFALCGDTDLLPLEDRAFLPFWLDALLGHPAAKLRDRDPWKLPEPRLYVQAQLRLAPKALGLPEDVPLGTLIQTLKARRAELDPPPLGFPRYRAPKGALKGVGKFRSLEAWKFGFVGGALPHTSTFYLTARNGGRRARSAAEPQSDRRSPRRFAPTIASLR